MLSVSARTVVHGDDVQAVEQPPLVLVDPLHVDVKHGGRVDLHPVLILQVLSELHLVVLREKQKYVTWQLMTDVSQSPVLTRTDIKSARCNDECDVYACNDVQNETATGRH